MKTKSSSGIFSFPFVQLSWPSDLETGVPLDTSSQAWIQSVSDVLLHTNGTSVLGTIFHGHFLSRSPPHSLLLNGWY